MPNNIESTLGAGINIVLVEPRIPQNTGNIGRLCVAVGATLHLIHPLGFRLEAKETRRSGLDYWPRLSVFEWDNLAHFWDSCPFASNHFLLSTKAKRVIFEANFAAHSEIFLYFGREDAGLPSNLLDSNPNQVFKLPMLPTERSINLATATSATLYESIRQRSVSKNFITNNHAAHVLN